MKKFELVAALQNESYKADMVMYEGIRKFDLKKMGLIELKNIPKYRTKFFYALLFMEYKPGPYLWEEKEEYDRCYAINLDDSKKDEFAILFNERKLSHVENNFFIEEILCPKIGDKDRKFSDYDLYLNNNELFVLRKGKDKNSFAIPEESEKIVEGKFKYFDYLIDSWFKEYSKPAPAEGNPEVDYSITGEYDNLYQYILVTSGNSSSNKRPLAPPPTGYNCDCLLQHVCGIEKKLGAKLEQNSKKYY